MLKVELKLEPVGGYDRKHWQEKGIQCKGHHEVKKKSIQASQTKVSSIICLLAKVMPLASIVPSRIFAC